MVSVRQKNKVERDTFTHGDNSILYFNLFPNECSVPIDLVGGFFYFQGYNCLHHIDKIKLNIILKREWLKFISRSSYWSDDENENVNTNRNNYDSMSDNATPSFPKCLCTHRKSTGYSRRPIETVPSDHILSCRLSLKSSPISCAMATLSTNKKYFRPIETNVQSEVLFLRIFRVRWLLSGGRVPPSPWQCPLSCPNGGLLQQQKQPAEIRTGPRSLCCKYWWGLLVLVHYHDDDDDYFYILLISSSWTV